MLNCVNVTIYTSCSVHCGDMATAGTMSSSYSMISSFIIVHNTIGRPTTALSTAYTESRWKTSDQFTVEPNQQLGPSQEVNLPNYILITAKYCIR